MIVLDCEQGSDEWRQARCGIPTASNFHRIITPKTAKPSTQQEGYLDELIAERQLGRPLDDASSGFMERGKELEAEAIAWFDFMASAAVRRVGFVLRDDKKAGCSPDGICGDTPEDSYGIEVKCLAAKNHVAAVRRGLTEDYRPQVQGSLWLTGFSAWHMIFFNPELDSRIIVVERDEQYIEALAAAVDAFIGRLEEACNG